MPRKYTQITFTDSVKAAQTHFGSRATAEKVAAWETDDEHLSEREASFIAARDSFYMATVNEDGWPYVQYRGGPQGFLKVLDDKTLAYADFGGNKQYVSMGNLRHDERTALFFVDYPNRQRLKLMARTEVFDADERPELLAQVADPDYKARVERVMVLHVVAFDWNCPQHITPRYTEAEWVEQAMNVGEGDPS
jgi:predicted pyridoxine 5'-phosphate oxidase superfamily flavin-nucleotide-binding protein